MRMDNLFFRYKEPQMNTNERRFTEPGYEKQQRKRQRIRMTRIARIFTDTSNAEFSYPTEAAL